MFRMHYGVPLGTSNYYQLMSLISFAIKWRRFHQVRKNPNVSFGSVVKIFLLSLFAFFMFCVSFSLRLLNVVDKSPVPVRLWGFLHGMRDIARSTPFLLLVMLLFFEPLRIPVRWLCFSKEWHGMMVSASIWADWALIVNCSWFHLV